MGKKILTHQRQKNKKLLKKRKSTSFFGQNKKQKMKEEEEEASLSGYDSDNEFSSDENSSEKMDITYSAIFPKP